MASDRSIAEQQHLPGGCQGKGCVLVLDGLVVGALRQCVLVLIIKTHAPATAVAGRERAILLAVRSTMLSARPIWGWLWQCNAGGMGVKIGPDGLVMGFFLVH